jgi:CIC family chloride channel protein
VASLGTGASGGREGPISLIGAGLGAWAARRLGLTVRDRRILLAAGIAGGIAAVFRAPLAAAIFAAEVLYRGPDLEADVLIPAFIAAVVGYLAGTLGLDLLGPLAGHQGVLASTVFQAPAVAFRVADWPHLAGYTLVAGACALVARGFIGLQAGVTGRFDRLAVPFWIKPGIGAGIAGLVAVAVFLALATALGSRDEARIGLSTIGSGYGVVHWLFAGLGAPFHHLVLAGLLLVIALAKTLTTALCVGSGGSAGLFGPVIVIGGCTGGAIGLALEGLPVAPPMPACVLMGMAGLLAATHRTPVAALLMVAEIAGSYLLLLPAMWVSGTAFLLVGRRSLIGGQVDSPADSPAHRAEGMRGALADLRVADLLDPGTRSVVAPDLGIEQVQQRLTECPALAVVGADGRLHGLIDRDGLHGWAPDPYLRALIRAVDLADGAALALRPGDSVATALQRFRQHRVEVLAVTAGDGRFIGLLTAAALMGAIRDRMEPRP